jgi:GH35 family endo-1,4-beta-xylanase
MRVPAGTAAVAALLLFLATPALARTGPVELGTAVGGPDFMSDSDPRYRETMKLFDALTAENDMKMYYQRPSRAVFDFAVGDAMVAFAAANSQQMHGHTLIWCDPSSTPGWVRNGSWTRATLLAVMREHITAVMNHYRGKVASWDVANEALADDGSLRRCTWRDVIGPDWIEQAFRIARSVDAGPRLFYNEVRADVPNPKYEALLAMARDFKARGVPLDGVGLQYHLSDNQPTQAQMEEAIRRLGELGLDVHISELDVPIWYLGPPTIPERLAIQPEIYRRVASACQAQPACFRITTWGFTDRLTYRCCNAKPLPFDEEYRPKPAWAVLQEVLRPGGPTRPAVPPPPAPQPTAPQATAAARGPLTVSARLKRRRLRTVLRRRALVVKLQVAGTDTAEVQLTARLRGRKLAGAVLNIASGRLQTAVVPLGFAERRRLRRARNARLVIEAVATDATGRRAKARITSG